jgi:hypothetical protein
MPFLGCRGGRSMNSPRVFTIEEVDALIPTLAHLVGEQLEQQSEIEERLAELTRLSGGLPRSLDDDPDESRESAHLKAELRELIARYENGWRRVSDLGAVIKDPQVGLVDFYGHIEGRLVWLCWKYGEESLGFYHELEKGYAARRPLRAELRERLLN